MSEQAGHMLARLVILSLIILLFVMAYTFITNYNGRQSLVDSQRRGCERSKLDRDANAEGWRAAEKARLNTLSTTLHIPIDSIELLINRRPLPDDPSDLVAARRYDAIASGLEKRSKIDCDKAFPKASLIP